MESEHLEWSSKQQTLVLRAPSGGIVANPCKDRELGWKSRKNCQGVFCSCYNVYFDKITTNCPSDWSFLLQGALTLSHL